MQHDLNRILTRAISNVALNKEIYVNDPRKDFSRNRILTLNNIIRFSMSKGAKALSENLLEYFMGDIQTPTVSAYIQQCNKLRVEAFKQVLMEFNKLTKTTVPGLNIYAVDGTSLEFTSNSKYSSDEYYVKSKNFYQMHIVALYDLINQCYCDAEIQPIHQKNEFVAFSTMVKRQPNLNTLFIGDIGFCSYNNIATIIEKGSYFLLRCKDINSKGISSNFDYPTEECFDINVDVDIVRTKKHIQGTAKYVRFINPKIQFDFLPPNSNQVYNIKFRVVRFKLSDDSYECILTNLPDTQYTPEKLKELYNMRWGIETSFRQLKHTICLKYTHSYKPKFVEQQIWASLLMYNFTVYAINQANHKKKRKYNYKANFAFSLAICKQYISFLRNILKIDLYKMIVKNLIPIRDNRKFKRSKTDHTRNPKGFNYRPQ